MWFSFSFWIERRGVHSRREIVYLSFILTLSKAILFVVPSILMGYLMGYLTWSWLWCLIVFGAFTSIAIYFLGNVIVSSILPGLKGVDLGSDLSSILNNELFWRIITFGRSKFLTSAYEHGAFQWPNILFGSGIRGMELLLPNKIGIEMDLFDSISGFGFLGLAILIGFYYLPLLVSLIGARAKVAFVLVILYSAVGGHFFNNPLVGSYYGIYLGLISNRTMRGNYIASRALS